MTQPELDDDQQAVAGDGDEAVEARTVELRRANPGWGPRSILHRLERDGVDPLPGRSSVHRALVRHGLINPTRRRRRRADYTRWERSLSMELCAAAPGGDSIPATRGKDGFCPPEPSEPAEPTSR